ncbi:MAG: alpha-ketoacid dehydrogenase subunit beta [Chloroflexota bacterium]
MSEQPTLRQALRSVLRGALLEDPEMVIMGEVIASRGGSTYVLEGVADELGRDRILETPVSENAIAGASFGAALAGMTVVAEIFAADFLFATGNEVWNDMAKWRYQHRWEAPIRLVVRAPMGSNHGCQGPEHTQCMEAYLAHSPGLTVVVPSTVAEGAELMRQSLGLGDPVIFLEHRRLYDHRDDPASPALTDIRLGTPTQYSRGDDVTIVAWGWMLQEALRATARLRERGFAVDLFSLHTLRPLDFQPIRESLARTGRLIVVEEAPRTLGVGAELVARGYESANGRPIDACRVTMPDVIIPFSPAIETPLIPDAEDVLQAAEQMIGLVPKAVHHP